MMLKYGDGAFHRRSRLRTEAEAEAGHLKHHKSNQQ